MIKATTQFSNNTSTNYTTSFNHPLVLDGDWEVGVESVCYNSKIDGTEENASITASAYAITEIPITTVYKFNYKLKNDGKWNYDWVYINSDYYGSDNVKMCNSLNKGNKQIVHYTAGDLNNDVFNFHQSTRKKDKAKDESSNALTSTVRLNSDSFAIRITEEVAQRLGLGSRTTLNGKEFTPGGAYFSCEVKDNANSVQLTRESYKFKVFDSNMIVCEEEIVLKQKDEEPYSLEEFVRRWNDTIGKKYKDLATVSEGKVVINKKSGNITYVIGYFLSLVIKIEEPLISDGIFTATANYTYLKHMKDNEYRVFVYGDTLHTAKKKTERNFTITIRPRAINTILETNDILNKKLENELKSQFGNQYDKTKHKINFGIEKQKTLLTLGSQIKLEMSENLRVLFGYINTRFKGTGSFVSFESPLSLDSREQHLYIQSNIITPVQYGTQREYILAHFVHDKRSTYGLTEKLFEPILFNPIIKPVIQQINLSITNGLHRAVPASDIKTLVTLIFRRKQ